MSLTLRLKKERGREGRKGIEEEKKERRKAKSGTFCLLPSLLHLPFLLRLRQSPCPSALISLLRDSFITGLHNSKQHQAICRCGCRSPDGRIRCKAYSDSGPGRGYSNYGCCRRCSCRAPPGAATGASRAAPTKDASQPHLSREERFVSFQPVPRSRSPELGRLPELRRGPQPSCVNFTLTSFGRAAHPQLRAQRKPQKRLQPVASGKEILWQRTEATTIALGQVFLLRIRIALWLAFEQEHQLYQQN